MKVGIIYRNFLDKNGVERHVGGVETYLLNLGDVCAEMDWTPFLFQRADTAFRKTIGPLSVTGVPVARYSGNRQKRELFASALQEINLKKDILIFGADHCSIPVRSPHCIAIQHGVSWDLPITDCTQRRLWRTRLGARLVRSVFVKRAIRDFENCQNRVCVDYNFLNWYRTIVTGKVQGRVWVILNATPLAKEEDVVAREHAKGRVRVLFARRFERYRGTRIMAEAVKHILRDNGGVSFTFAGEGPDEGWLRHCFSGDARVIFARYVPGNAITTLLDHDLAVIPSLGSEGSSISVAEGMAAGCAVVATAVGGVTNMIINDYNGLLVTPDVNSLVAALQRVITDVSLRRELGRNAYHTAREAFNLGKWKSQWRAVLEEVAHA